MSKKAKKSNYRNYDYCGDCGIHCDSGSLSISCTICNRIFHRKCKKLSIKTFRNYKENHQSYICSDICYNLVLPFAGFDDIDFLAHYMAKVSFLAKNVIKIA